MMKRYIKNNLILELEKENIYQQLNSNNTALFYKRVNECIRNLHRENIEDKIYYSYLKIKYSLMLCEKDARQEQKVLLKAISDTLKNIKVENDTLISISSYILKDKINIDDLIDIYNLLLQTCSIHDSRDHFVESTRNNYHFKQYGLKTLNIKSSNEKEELIDINSKIKELTKS